MDEDKVLNAIKALDEKLTGRIDDLEGLIGDLDHKIDDRFNILRQDVRILRPLVGKIAQEMGPYITASKQDLENLQREQEKFNLRLEEVERKIAGMSA